MGKKTYRIGLMASDKQATNGYQTVEWEKDYSGLVDARNRAKELSRLCPFLNGRSRVIAAIEVLCIEKDEATNKVSIPWSDIYVGGKVVKREEY